MKKVLLPFTLLLSFSFLSTAQTSLQGMITDSETGEELIGANIVIKKNNIHVTGVSTDFNGNYSVNIDEGTYDVTVSYLGFPTNLIQKVIVKPGQTNLLNIEMRFSVNGSKDEIVVTEYKVPLIKVENTTGGCTITAEKIQHLPTRNVSALASVAAGISTTEESRAVTVRGSRADATDYYIDGVRVRGSGSMVPRSEIDQIQLITGGTPAQFEHSSAISVEGNGNFTRAIDNPNPFATERSFGTKKTVKPKKEPTINSGILTAGEWNGLEDWMYWKNLLETQDKLHQQQWQFFPSSRFLVKVVNQAGFALTDCDVKLLDESERIVWQTKTDHHGKAELWANLYGGTGSNFKLTAAYDNFSSKVVKAIPYHQGNNEIHLPVTCNTLTNLDIAFVVDATGSMSDEINYLKVELRDVIEKVKAKNDVLKIQTASVFYRDHGDEYVTRNSPFSKNLNKTMAFIHAQNATGGGDYAEAMDAALEKVLDMNWSEKAIARILFLVLDAPPHNDPNTIEKLQGQIQKAAKLGIQIIPITASGIGQSTEFLLKSMAITTNGTYAFITDHSGIGNPHLEATVSEYTVEMLNDMMVRLISDFSEQINCKTPKKKSLAKNVEELNPSPLQSNNLSQMVAFYPNPAEDQVFVDLKEKFSHIRLVNVTGKTVKTINYPEIGVNRMDVSDLPGGAYLIQFQKGTEVITKRLIVAKP